MCHLFLLIFVLLTFPLSLHTIAQAEEPEEPLNIVTVAGTGVAGSSGDGGPATTAFLNSPGGVAFDAAGNLHIVDANNHRIRRVDLATGIITTVAGTGVAGFSGDGGPATAAQLNLPRGLAFDAAGNLYIADANNHRIRRVDLATGIITTVAGTGVAGFSGDGGPATAAQLNLPRGLAFDAAGNLYIADANNHRIRRVDLATGIITTVAGTGVAGFSGDGGPATAAQLNLPRGLAFDAAGNLYIADANNHRIRRVDLATGIITTVAGTGVAGFSGDGGSATAAQLNFPQGLAFDAAGNLHIVDANNHRIRRVDLATGIITTVAGTGVAGFSGDGGSATAAQLNFPQGLAFDAAGNLIVGDQLNNRVRRLNVAATIDMDPDTINTRSKGKWVTVYIEFTPPRDPNNVNPLTVSLQAVDPVTGAPLVDLRLDGPAEGAPPEIADTTLMLKYDQSTVQSWGEPSSDLHLRVEGQFFPPADSTVGRYFSGDTVIRLR